MTQHPFKSQQHMPKKEMITKYYIYISQCKDKVGNQQKSLINILPQRQTNRKKIIDRTKFKQKKMQPTI